MTRSEETNREIMAKLAGPTWVRAATLARLVGVTPATVTRHLKALVADGWAEVAGTRQFYYRATAKLDFAHYLNAIGDVRFYGETAAHKIFSRGRFEASANEIYGDARNAARAALDLTGWREKRS